MRSITVIIPAYMEAANIENAVSNSIWALEQAKIGDYELLVIDCKRPDGTDDGTPEIAERLAEKNGHIRVFHNPYINMGEKYWMGVDAARMSYIVLVPGDDELPKESFKGILNHLGEADILTTYTANMQVRPLMRRVISKTFTFLVNMSTGLKLRYYNGDCVLKTEAVRSVTERDQGFGYMARLLTHLIKKGNSYKEIPINLQKRGGGKATALRPANFIGVGKTIFDLFWKYRILNGGR